MDKPALILTVELDSKAFTYFNALRTEHFPPERNFISAHLTLFHALQNQSATIDKVQEISETTNPFSLLIESPVSIGKGVAFKIQSPPLLQLHKKLQLHWKDNLTPQDSQGLWPHITVQNKVSPAEAQQLLFTLMQSFQQFDALATGLQLWEYLGGPWKQIQTFPFALRE